MKKLIHIFTLLICSFSLNAQTEIVWEKGTATFTSSRNVYVKFTSTEKISVGDTLFVKNGEVLSPVLTVSNKSSSSTVCSPLSEQKFKKGDEFFAKTKLTKKEKKKEEIINNDVPANSVEEEINADEPIAPLPELTAEEVRFKQKIRGRLSASSYSNLTSFDTTHRMRYAFSFRGDNLKNSRWSTDNYINFRHTIGEWAEVQDNFAQALKIYSLSVKYQFSENSNIILGRKINPKTSSMGAIDGIQYEQGFGKSFVVGALAGTRPDFQDYGFNPNLLQGGLYASFTSPNPKKYRLTTLGFVEQRNGSNTDRRFVYFQHSGELLPKLNLFASAQMDLYENIRGEINNSPRLTNLYVTLRYRFSKKFRINASYDNRQNIIFYESYKSYIDRLIEQETRQGARLGVSYRITKRINWGATANIRFQNSGANDSRNLNTYVSISRLPGNWRANFRGNFIQNSYLTGLQYSARFSKSLFKKKVNADLNYRFVDYQYSNAEVRTMQHIGGVNFSFNLMKRLTMYMYYEGTYDDKSQVFHRVNMKLIKRF